MNCCFDNKKWVNLKLLPLRVLDKNLMWICLTLSQMANFRLFQTEWVCRQQFQIWWKLRTVFQMSRKHCEKKDKLLVTSNFFFSHSVFKRLNSRQTFKSQGFGKGLIKAKKIKILSSLSFLAKIYEKVQVWSWSIKVTACKNNLSWFQYFID